LIGPSRRFFFEFGGQRFDTNGTRAIENVFQPLCARRFVGVTVCSLWALFTPSFRRGLRDRSFPNLFPFPDDSGFALWLRGGPSRSARLVSPPFPNLQDSPKVRFRRVFLHDLFAVASLIGTAIIVLRFPAYIFPLRWRCFPPRSSPFREYRSFNSSFPNPVVSFASALRCPRSSDSVFPCLFFALSFAFFPRNRPSGIPRFLVFARPAATCYQLQRKVTLGRASLPLLFSVVLPLTILLEPQRVCASSSMFGSPLIPLGPP